MKKINKILSMATISTLSVATIGSIAICSSCGNNNENEYELTFKSSFEENDKQISLAFKGTTKKAPIIEQLPKEHTLLKVLTQNIFANTAYFGHFLINSYLGYETFVFTDKQLELFENLPVLEKTKQFCIYGNEERILVEIF